jgi:hypothetical protein
MKGVWSLCLAGWLAATPVFPQNAQERPEAVLAAAITQYTKGDLALTVSILEGVIVRMAPQRDRYVKELTQAYVYRGAALVGLGLEDKGKGSFAAALTYADHLRITEREFPARVVRAFETARTEKVAADFVPPPKGGAKIGGLGVAAIGGGALAAGVAVVAATTGGSDEPPVEPRLTFLSSSPAPGSTMTVVPGGALPLSMNLMLLYPTEISQDGDINISLVADNGTRCVSMSASRLYAPAGREFPLLLASFRFVAAGTAGCDLPWSSTRIAVTISRAGTLLHDQTLAVSYNFATR